METFHQVIELFHYMTLVLKLLHVSENNSKQINCTILSHILLCYGSLGRTIESILEWFVSNRIMPMWDAVCNKKKQSVPLQEHKSLVVLHIHIIF